MPMLSASRFRSRSWICWTLPILMVAVVTASCTSAASDQSTEQADRSSAESPESSDGSNETESNETESLPTENEVPGTTPTDSPTSRAGAALDQAFADQLISQINQVGGAVLFAIVRGDGTMAVASTGTDRNGDAPAVTNGFRVGSITKTFTALMVLMLVDEGLVDLDAPLGQYVSRVNTGSGVTVRNLLQHRSGLFNYTDDPTFFPQILTDPGHIWTPEEILQGVQDRAPLFEQGDQFSYSNSNYVLLGLLIEEVTGRPYHQVLQDRLIEPLGLTATYLDGMQPGPEPFDTFSFDETTAADFTGVATSAWSAGALVSSAPDLHLLYRALFNDEIVSAELLDQMTTGDEYGFGVVLDSWPDGIVGHGGGIPGAVTMVMHSPQVGVTTFIASTGQFARLSPTVTQSIATALAADS